VTFADSAVETIAAVERLLSLSDEGSLVRDRASYASAHSWESRTEEALKLIDHVTAKNARLPNG